MEFIVEVPVIWAKLLFITEVSEYCCTLNVFKYLCVQIHDNRAQRAWLM